MDSYRTLQVGKWEPEPDEDGNSVSPKTSEEPQWLGTFSEYVKCHNPGELELGSEERLPKLTITTVLVSEKLNNTYNYKQTLVFPLKSRQDLFYDPVSE